MCTDFRDEGTDFRDEGTNKHTSKVPTQAIRCPSVLKLPEQYCSELARVYSFCRTDRDSRFGTFTLRAVPANARSLLGRIPT